MEALERQLKRTAERQKNARKTCKKLRGMLKQQNKENAELKQKLQQYKGT